MELFNFSIWVVKGSVFLSSLVVDDPSELFIVKVPNLHGSIQGNRQKFIIFQMSYPRDFLNMCIFNAKLFFSEYVEE